MSNKDQTKLNMDLIAACISGANDSEINTLINSGADIDFQNADGKTPINVAAEKGHTHVIKLLIARGANLSIVDNLKQSPLSVACHNSKKDANYNIDKKWLEIIRLIIQAGAPINEYDNLGKTPLLICVNKGDDVSSELLVKSGADIEATVRSPTKFHSKHYTSLGSIDVDNQTIGYTPLWLAVSQDDKYVLAVLIRHGAKLNVADNYINETPLIYSCVRNFIECAHLLIRGGADINLQDRIGNSALMNVCKMVNKPKKQIAIAKMLIDMGANVYLRNEKKMNASDIVKESDADITFKNKMNALISRAVTRNVRKMAKKLVGKTRKGFDYDTARSIAVEFLDPDGVSSHSQYQRSTVKPGKFGEIMNRYIKGGKNNTRKKVYKS
jgi:ankyrin repeat protein